MIRVARTHDLLTRWDKLRRMATYREIQDYVRRRHGFVVKTCWIAHVKEQLGLPMRDVPNRFGAERSNPCPPDTKPIIVEALKDLGMIR